MSWDLKDISACRPEDVKNGAQLPTRHPVQEIGAGNGPSTPREAERTRRTAEVRWAKVLEVQERIATGQYRVSAEQLAESMLSSARRNHQARLRMYSA